MTEARVEEARPAGADEWDAAWEGCDYATYFHSREWAELWQSWNRGAFRPVPRLVRFEDGAHAVLAASMRRGRVRLLDVAELSPAGTFGGWVSSHALGPGHVAALVRSALTLAPRVRWRLNPYDPLAASVVARVFAEDTTQVVELASDFERVLHRWDQGQRQKVAQARRGGISVRLAAGLDDWRAYFDAYRDSLRRWGARTTSEYPWRFFERLAALKSPRVRLWVATLDGNVIAGTLCFYARRHVAYWHGAALEEHIKKRPMNLLLHDAMQHACEAGMSWFDFNPSGGHESVRAFKAGFGVTALPANIVGRDAGPAGWMARLRRGGR